MFTVLIARISNIATRAAKLIAALGTIIIVGVEVNDKAYDLMMKHWDVIAPLTNGNMVYVTTAIICLATTIASFKACKKSGLIDLAINAVSKKSKKRH